MPSPFSYYARSAWSALARPFSLKASRARAASASPASDPPPYGASGGAFGGSRLGGSLVSLGGSLPGLSDPTDSLDGPIPFLGNVVVAAAVSWYARNFPVPDLHVVEDATDETGQPTEAEVPDHWLIARFDKPNPNLDFFGFFALCVISDLCFGETILLKRKTRGGDLVDFWWLPPNQVEVKGGGEDGGTSKYLYRPGWARELSYDPTDIVHIKNLPDPTNPLRGYAPLAAPGVLRSIRVIDAIGRYDDRLMSNFGIVPYAITPADPKMPIPRESVPNIQATFKRKYSPQGTEAGEPFVSVDGLVLTRLGFSPEEMAVDQLPLRHVANICAVLGTSAMTLGFPDPSKTYANAQVADRASYTNGLMPMQGRFAEAFNRDPDLIAEGERLKWDYAHVPALQDDEATQIDSLVKAVGGPILTKDEARARLHLPPWADVAPEEETPEPPVDPLGGVPGTDGTAAPGTDGASALPPTLAARTQALAAASGNGNGNGAAKSHDPDLADLVADRAAAVLSLAEAKLAEIGIDASDPDWEAKYRACRDARGRFASCGGGGAISQDIRHVTGRGGTPTKPGPHDRETYRGGGGAQDPHQQARAAIKTAHEEQRAANAAEAKANPIRKDDLPDTHLMKSYKQWIKEAEEEKVQDERNLRDLKPKLDELTKKRDQASQKMWDYGLSSRTRKTWEKKYNDINKEYQDIHGKVWGAETRLKGNSTNLPYHHQRIDNLKSQLMGLEAVQARKSKVDYAALQAKHPDLLPPGPITDRIAAYKVGDVKVKAIEDAGVRFEQKSADLAIRRTELSKSIDGHIREQMRVIEEAEAAGIIPAHDPVVRARVDALQKEIEKTDGAFEALKREQKEHEQNLRGQITELIAPENPAEFRTGDISPGFTTGSGPLTPPTGGTADATTEARTWLSRTVARGDNEAIDVKVGEGPSYRAHYGSATSKDPAYIQAETNERPDTMVHEFGHAIDDQMQVGGRKVLDRSNEFLAHRVGNETPVDLHQKFGCGDLGEMGRKDEFDKVFSQYSAHYVGKDYKGYATEIVSMGLQKLYEDPVGFVRKDPEYARYILGIMDGSLR